jgi:purine-binding chemotaxis protein CheW
LTTNLRKTILDQRGGLLGLTIMAAGTDAPGRLRALLCEIVCRKTPGRCAGRAEDVEQMTIEATETASQAARGRSAATANGSEEAGRASWLICRAGTHLCAMPLERVVEIMRLLPIEPVSGAPRYVCGMCIIRGSPVPVVDTGLLLCDQAIRPERLVTIRAGSRMIAFAAETVLGIREIGAEASNLLPPLLRDAATETIAGIGTLDAELLFFLRTARIVPEELFDRLDADGAAS